MVVDERIDNQELQENETDTEDSAEIQRSEENEMEKLDEPIVPSGQALQRIQRQLFNGILERLGPTATQDPYEYIYPSGEVENEQHRYPKFTTNDYTKVLGNWTQSNERYQGDKGSPYDGENLIDDSDYTNGERTGEITTMLLIMDQLQAKKIETFQLKPFSFGEMNGI